MKLNGRRRLVRVYIGARDRWKGKPLHEAILDEARALGMAGATVVKGIAGYGCNAHRHTPRLLEPSADTPLIVELVDTEANVERLLPALELMVDQGLVTVESVDVLVYRAEGAQGRTRKNGGD